jgi:prepilin-type N-terminal cleavage/methylation domain-containing protein
VNTARNKKYLFFNGILSLCSRICGGECEMLSLYSRTRVLSSGGHSGFTLVELLVSMTIISVILGLSVSGYYGLRTTMILKQSAETLKSDIMYAKRSAMLIKREQDEQWINGVGIDIASMSIGEPAYRVFKYCADDNEYKDFEVENEKFTYGSCESSGVSELTFVPGYDKVTVSSSTLDFYTNLPVRFVFFESPTGEMHLYDCNGVEINLEDQESDIFLVFALGTRSYYLQIKDNGEVQLGTHDEIPEDERLDVCDNEINLFE